jgi:hypothetical protein
MSAFAAANSILKPRVVAVLPLLPSTRLMTSLPDQKAFCRHEDWIDILATEANVRAKQTNQLLTVERKQSQLYCGLMAGLMKEKGKHGH